MIINEVLFVEIFVGMGKMVAWWHEHALGFSLKGKREFKGQHGQQISYWLQNGDANLIITSALEPAAHDLVSFIDRHGNSIKRFAIEVDDIELFYDKLRLKNAIILSAGIEWQETKDEKCGVIRCKLFDDNEIVFVQRINCQGPLPGFTIQEKKKKSNSVVRIDHLASAVRTNESDFWNNYLLQILDLKHVQTIGEEFFANLSTGMKMHVLSSKDNKFNKVIVEPLPEKTRKSQVDIFLQHNFGSGIQHLAFEVDDLIDLVKDLKSRGVVFTPVPQKYYDEMQNEFPDLPIEMMRKSNVLCEKDGDKLLLQVFTEPIGDRPTLFYEFIQRVNNYDGFGARNVHQLFKSLEIHINGEA
jgi:4-hydroxyphenylpyruvate dioxygenase